MNGPRLEDLLRKSAARTPDAPAVRDGGTGDTISYRDLDARSDELAERLTAADVVPGDRIAVKVTKSIDAVAAIFGALKAGAAYVPIDVDSPEARTEKILAGCTAAVLITHDENGDLLLTPRDGERDPGAPDLAYLLFTSGSTGDPKGVIHTHASALSFVEWACDTFAPTADDRFASHAPFHFDLSIFDLYVPLRHGALLVLFDEGLGRFPAGLARTIATERISVWYSTPSTLRMLMTFGQLEDHEFPDLRLVLYAGEVFAANQLSTLKETWPHPRYANLYGPTETNVCTWFEVPDSWDAARTDPFPIGRCCPNDEALVVDAEDRPVTDDGEGELCIRGGTVMAGYWADPDRTAASFLTDDAGKRWYRTGDVVRTDEHGDFMFLGRRDRMVKRRGFRIELGEIEVALGTLAAVTEAAVVAVPDPDAGVAIRAFVTTEGDEKPTLVAFKRHCASRLPAYMIPDRFTVIDAMPHTSTDKIDYQNIEKLP